MEKISFKTEIGVRRRLEPWKIFYSMLTIFEMESSATRHYLALVDESAIMARVHKENENEKDDGWNGYRRESVQIHTFTYLGVLVNNINNGREEINLMIYKGNRNATGQIMFLE